MRKPYQVDPLFSQTQIFNSPCVIKQTIYSALFGGVKVLLLRQVDNLALASPIKDITKAE